MALIVAARVVDAVVGIALALIGLLGTLATVYATRIKAEREHESIEEREVTKRHAIADRGRAREDSAAMLLLREERHEHRECMERVREQDVKIAGLTAELAATKAQLAYAGEMIAWLTERLEALEPPGTPVRARPETPANGIDIVRIPARPDPRREP